MCPVRGAGLYWVGREDLLGLELCARHGQAPGVAAQWVSGQGAGGESGRAGGRASEAVRRTLDVPSAVAVHCRPRKDLLRSPFYPEPPAAVSQGDLCSVLSAQQGDPPSPAYRDSLIRAGSRSRVYGTSGR